MIQRIRKMFDFILAEVKSNPQASGKARFFMTKIVGEVLSDVDELPPEQLEEQLARSAAAMYWVATGQVIENLPVPEGFWDSVGYPAPSIDAIVSPKAIEGGSPVE